MVKRLLKPFGVFLWGLRLLRLARNDVIVVHCVSVIARSEATWRSKGKGPDARSKSPLHQSHCEAVRPWQSHAETHAKVFKLYAFRRKEYHSFAI